MKKNLYFLIIAATLLSCKGKPETVTKPLNDTIAVSVVEIKSQIIETNLRYSGTVEPSQSIPLSFQTTGIVEKVLVDAGDEVKKGQLLAVIEKTNHQSLYEMNLSKFNQARDAYERLKLVHGKGSLPEIKWVEMETNLEMAKSTLEVSKNNLENCELRAPENGIIGRRNIEPGMSSLSILSSPLELVKIKTVYVKISVPENEIGKIQKGDKASFSFSALNDKTFAGIVTNISPLADPISRTYDAKISVINNNLELKPGMVCDVALNIKSQNEVIVVPYQSVTKDGNGNAYVFLVDRSANRVKKQVVSTGVYLGNDMEILSGINPGQTIVKEGKEKLSDNTLIKF